MEKDKNFKSNFIWNILGTGLNAFTSFFFLIAVTRINGINDAGIFTIAYSTACILYVIGIYAGRVFQVTEVDKKVKDKEYIANRLISCLIMMIITIGFVLFKKYNLYKASVFILLSLYKCLEAFSDVLYGILQKNNLLNKVGKSYFIKAASSIVVFILVDIITHNVIVSCIAIIALWIFAIIFYDIRNIKNLVDFNSKVNTDNVIKIFKNCFFVFAITFLGLYIMNAPKYAIDSYLTEDIQAIFGIIVMPATIMGLIGQFLIHPYLNTIVNLYNEKDFKGLNKLILKIILYILAFGIFASVVAYFLGIPVLNLVYGIDLSGYELHLVAIIVASTLYNIGVIYSSVLTTIRHTLVQFIIYTAVSIFALIISNILTIQNGITGSVIAYFLIMLLQFISYFIVTNVVLRKVFKRKGIEEK
ncbi:MAG: lipopolysaccharide biosynthesis protein [Clostridia bacterium]